MLVILILKKGLIYLLIIHEVRFLKEMYTLLVVEMVVVILQKRRKRWWCYW